jgi:hypothetical protein
MFLWQPPSLAQVPTKYDPYRVPGLNGLKGKQFENKTPEELQKLFDLPYIGDFLFEDYLY